MATSAWFGPILSDVVHRATSVAAGDAGNYASCRACGQHSGRNWRRLPNFPVDKDHHAPPDPTHHRRRTGAHRP
ncbi:protein of unknown function [Cupriavidus taiwanensis]|nr:protein of unknown function [Cupriavidus taiwanensis]